MDKIVLKFTIPLFVQKALEMLTQEGFGAFLVGGCVRDLLLRKEPKDWDITTNAKPEDIERVFTSAGYKTFYENAFGTVTVIIDDTPIEITPYRLEGKYSDKRHPDEIQWAKTLEEDLARRDFTINAMAITTNDLRPTTYDIIDLFDGQEDLKNKIIRTVGEPSERFSEDALRLMRAVRFATQLKFTIEEKTEQAIKENAPLLQMIAKERIRDELVKIISSDEPEKGILILQKIGLLHIVLPELEEGSGLSQRGPHRYDIFRHNLYALKWASRETDDTAIRLASLLHDIGKPKTRALGEKGIYTFYDHQIVGAEIAKKILTRLKFPKKIIDEVYHLIYHHMFYYEVDKVTPSGVRRLLQRVGGKEVFDKLLVIRRADRRATPVPKTHPYRLRHLEYMVEKVASDPLSRFQLVINGDDIIKALAISPSPRVGFLIKALLAQVLEDPAQNTREYLLQELKELNKKTDEELSRLGAFVETKKKERDIMLKEKHWVR